MINSGAFNKISCKLGNIPSYERTNFPLLLNHSHYLIKLLFGGGNKYWLSLTVPHTLEFKESLHCTDLETRVMQTGANVFGKNDLQHLAPCSVLPLLLTPENAGSGPRACRQEATLLPCKILLNFTAFTAHYLYGEGDNLLKNKER